MCDFTEGYDIQESFDEIPEDISEGIGELEASDDIFDELTDDLDVEQLSYLKEEIQNGNEDLIELFGYGDTPGENEGYQKVLKL